MDRYEIRGLAVEHFLKEWESDGWQVDYPRGEVCVGDSWFPVAALPRILLNHMRGDTERREEKERQAWMEETFARTGNTWQSRARRLAAELAEKEAADISPSSRPHDSEHCTGPAGFCWWCD